MKQSVLVGALVGLLLSASTHAEAQSSGEEDARRLFDEGTTAIHAGDHERAVALLSRSLELRSHPATAYNLVQALQLAGELLRAGAECQRLEMGGYGALEAPSAQAQARALCTEIAEATPRIALEVRAMSRALERAEARVSVDDRPAQAVSVGVAVATPMNPGRHIVRVDADDALGEAVNVHIARGERRTLMLTIRERSSTQPQEVRVVDDSTRETARNRPARRRRIALGVTGVVVVVAAALAIGFAARSAAGPSNTDLGSAGT